MNNLPTVIYQSSLWRTALGEDASLGNAIERERLRTSFTSFRERASLLATEIRKDIPDLTVHDVSHLDALWEVSSLITGSSYLLTPTEGYVLGGAFLLHDLAMSVAATPGGIAALQNDPRWRDLLHNWFQENEQRRPTIEEISDPPTSPRQYALFNLLRIIHAENAEKLAFYSYQSPSGPLFLIEDTELRQTYGQIIGQIAHSHWWSIEEIEKIFVRIVGAPHWAPADWTVDPLKIACILRTADAAHIDARRAPTFLRAISPVASRSVPHWTFQEKLNKPYVRDDALVFTSGQAFTLQEANAWWLCLETLRMVDRELRSTDALLADKSVPRFTAKHVMGVEAPERLATYIKTADWLPINATVHISDLPHIIKSVGGEELYGSRPTVPLRELIQNGSDAVRARRSYESRDDRFGEIKISLLQEEGAYILCIEDCGIGMSRRVLTDFLLDFGRSFWISPEMQEELPGLLSSGFEATGKYGIGFFSVFMVADKVAVITRRADAAKKDTLVLEFGSGVSGRPILRMANTHEQLRDGGTIVRLLLKSSPYEKGGMLYSAPHEEARSLAEVCREIAPALDVRLKVVDNGIESLAVEANDWRTIDGGEFLERLGHTDFGKKGTREYLKALQRRAARNLRELKDHNGKVIGRACISVGFAAFTEHIDINGQLVVGGLTASPLSGIAGVLLATPKRAARDQAAPLASTEVLARWADEQADLVPQLWSSAELQLACAQNIRICGGKTKCLPIAFQNDKWLSALDIENMSLPDTVILIDNFIIRYKLKHVRDLRLSSNVFVTSSNGIPAVFQDAYYFTERRHDDQISLSLAGAVIESVAKSWGVQVEDLKKSNDFDKEGPVSIGTGAFGEIIEDAVVIQRPHGVKVI